MQNERLKSILITGGSGFIGSNLMARLLARGFSVVNYDIKEPIDFGLYKLLNAFPDKYRYVKGDVLDKGLLTDTIKANDIGYVIHLAAILGTMETFEHVSNTYNVNVVGTANVAEACMELNIKCTYLDTGNDWFNPYTQSKRASVKMLLSLNRWDVRNFIILRGFNIFGPRQKISYPKKFFPAFCSAIIEKKKILITGNGNQEIVPVSVDTLIDSIVKTVMLHKPSSLVFSTVFPISPGTRCKVNDFVKVLIGESLNLPQKTVVDNWNDFVEYAEGRKGEEMGYLDQDSDITTRLLDLHIPEYTNKEICNAFKWYRDNYQGLKQINY